MPLPLVSFLQFLILYSFSLMYNLMCLNCMAMEIGLNKVIKAISLLACFPANPCVPLLSRQPAPGKHHEQSRAWEASSEQTEMVLN